MINYDNDDIFSFLNLKIGKNNNFSSILLNFILAVSFCSG